MKKNILENVRIIVLAGILSLGVGVAFAGWTPAPSSAPDNNVEAPLNISSANQVKLGGLWVNALGASNGLVVPDGNVGIGTSGIPSGNIKLEVVGTVKIAGGNPGVGKVLTSDANGLASWQQGSAIYKCADNSLKLDNDTACAGTQVGHLIP